MIEFQNVRKRLGGRNVLNGMTFDVREGETMVLLGPSGTGKSVTLNHIIGLMSPDSGTVTVMGQEVAQLAPDPLAALRSRIGMLFQSGALLDWMNIYDNVALPLRVCLRMPEDRIRARLDEIFQILELSDSIRKMPTEISGGMKKRAGLARAIAVEPRLMLYDEPTSGLDPVMSRKIDSLINSLKERFHMTSVVVTHDLCSALAIADRIAMLSHGIVLECSAPDVFMKSRNPLIREFIDAQFSIRNGVRK